MGVQPGRSQLSPLLPFSLPLFCFIQREFCIRTLTLGTGIPFYLEKGQQAGHKENQCSMFLLLTLQLFINNFEFCWLCQNSRYERHFLMGEIWEEYTCSVLSSVFRSYLLSHFSKKVFTGTVRECRSQMLFI